MRNRAKHEILTGIQYLLIGIIAEVAVTRWVGRDGGDAVKPVAAWFLIAATLTILRLAVIILVGALRRDQWQTISRRNWI
jgi:hypothetical protein